jgi:zinc transport system substrate-binding protein
LAKAEVPRVVTSIAPLQGLVADIMTGVGTPELLLSEPISTHDFAMRPSQAKAISDADILFYIGQHLEPWLEKALQARSDNGLVIALGDLPNLTLLEARELDEFGEHHEDHDHDHEGTYDPHLWLDPENVLIWLDIITGTLEIADPDNKEIYRENLARSRDAIVAATNDAHRSLAPLAQTNLIVTHDSIQYFEHAFGLTVIGAFSASDGQVAGARSLNTLLGSLDAETCIVEDFTHPSGITANLPDNVRRVVIDPMGYDLLGEGYYPRLLETLAQSLLKCSD